MHSLLFAAGLVLFFLFHSLLLLYIPMPVLLTVSKRCRELSECKVQGEQWEAR